MFRATFGRICQKGKSGVELTISPDLVVMHLMTALGRNADLKSEYQTAVRRSQNLMHSAVTGMSRGSARKIYQTISFDTFQEQSRNFPIFR